MPPGDGLAGPIPLADGPAGTGLADTGLANVVPPPDPTADTRFDLPPVTEDLMDAGYDLSPAPDRDPGPPAGRGRLRDGDHPRARPGR